MRVALFIAIVASFAARAEIPFAGEFKLPAEKILWQKLGKPDAAAFSLDWQPVDPSKDPHRPDHFWRQWPAPFSGFYAGVKIPADQFPLSNLYHDNKFFYPQASYDGSPDYRSFLDLHESLAWLYAFNSPANPLFRNHALRMRAQQLALIHLLYMTQEVPGGNIIGGYPIQYGNCVAWNARVLRWLDQTESLDPQLKAAWIECLDYILTKLDATGVNVLQTGMGHWNLWPVVGAYELWKTSGDPKHRALFEKWARTQLTPDAFTGRARFVSGASPDGYVRYSGIDLGYNGQAKNWLVPLYYDLGPDSIVGDFLRREYQFASFVSVEEPNGLLSSTQHMNSHSPQSTPYEQWAFHKHMLYAMEIPDARPFAVRMGFGSKETGGAENLIQRQKQMEGRKINVGMMAMGVRSYPSDYLHLPPELAWYPKGEPPDLSTRTRPMEHVAYAKFFHSPVERDEFFTRRMPAYHATIYSGPCRKEISNSGGLLNSIGAGGLAQLWIAGSGTMLLAATDLVQKPGDFEKVWAQLAINAMVAETAKGESHCTGWTGSLMDADEQGRVVTIRDGLAPGVQVSFGTPMTGKFHWRRRLQFSPDKLDVDAELSSDETLTRVAELLPIAFFKDTLVDTSSKRTKEIVVTRGKGTMRIAFDKPLQISWGQRETDLSLSTGQESKARALQIWLDPGETKIHYVIHLDAGSRETTPIVIAKAGAELPKANAGRQYEIAFEAPGARAMYWKIANGDLPAGLTLDPSGLLHGAPQAAGTFHPSVAAETPYTSRPFFEKNVPPVKMTLVIEP